MEWKDSSWLVKSSNVYPLIVLASCFSCSFALAKPAAHCPPVFLVQPPIALVQPLAMSGSNKRTKHKPERGNLPRNQKVIRLVVKSWYVRIQRCFQNNLICGKGGLHASLLPARNRCPLFSNWIPHWHQRWVSTFSWYLRDSAQDLFAEINERKNLLVGGLIANEVKLRYAVADLWRKFAKFKFITLR